MAYMPPVLSQVDFALETFTPLAANGVNFETGVYNPNYAVPKLSMVDFGLKVYTLPLLNAVNFVFIGSKKKIPKIPTMGILSGQIGRHVQWR